MGLCYLRPWEVDVPLEQLQKCVRQSGSDYCGSSIFHHCINVNSQRIDDFGRRLEQQTASINHLTDDFIYFTRLYSFSIFIIAGHEIPLCFRPAHTRGYRSNKAAAKWEGSEPSGLYFPEAFQCQTPATDSVRGGQVDWNRTRAQVCSERRMRLARFENRSRRKLTLHF